jgi:serine/threonine protein kinase
MVVPEALDIIEGVLRGIDQAHGLDIVHRDLKPANVIIGRDGIPKVMDFGIAQLGSRARWRAQRVGTPRYMAPEVIRQARVGSQCDVFALGLMLWEMLAGRAAFQKDDALRALDEVLEAELAPPSTHNPDVDPRLDALVAKAVEKDPQARYVTASEMLEVVLNLRNTEAADSAGSGQGTVAFLLRRMEG